MGKYDDIIDLPRHVSPYRKPMPMANRAAQFAPFAALNGHEEAIEETVRITERKKELSEEEINEISKGLSLAISDGLPLKIKFFCPDMIKQGGSYKSLYGKIKKYDEYDNLVFMDDGSIIPIASISEIEITEI